MLLVACAVQLFCQFSHILRVYARHPRADEDVAAESARSGDDLASRVVIYADARKLSRREQEVLTLVLKGNDAQNIASELVISPGTVKAHLHRIYVKSGVSNRDDLIDAFLAFLVLFFLACGSCRVGGHAVGRNDAVIISDNKPAGKACKPA